eukprot:TRINITY_DN29692_c0_g1_i1.p1 TRINITY_DN29692_c0_g1~~TRINITY_DN29692_c0_g1_i1.p1  ORF type:complete len:949 (-),score=102.17 TRINITY_DN29692_c0_g1_i1:51-2729(-)
MVVSLETQNRHLISLCPVQAQKEALTLPSIALLDETCEPVVSAEGMPGRPSPLRVHGPDAMLPLGDTVEAERLFSDQDFAILSRVLSFSEAIVERWKSLSESLLQKHDRTEDRIAFGSGTIGVNIKAAMRAMQLRVEVKEDEERLTPPPSPRPSLPEVRFFPPQRTAHEEPPQCQSQRTSKSSFNHRLPEKSWHGKTSSWRPSGSVSWMSPVGSARPSSAGPVSARPSLSAPAPSCRTSKASRYSNATHILGHRRGPSPFTSEEAQAPCLLPKAALEDGAPVSPSAALSPSGRRLSDGSGVTDGMSHGNFELAYVWTTAQAHNPKLLRRWECKKSNIATGAKTFLEATDVMHEPRDLNFYCGRLVMSPLRLHVVAWDIVGMLLILYDFFVVPLQILGLNKSVFTTCVAWFSRLFWTLSMLRSFFIGYVTPAGNVVMNPCRVLRHYLSGWFAFDVVVVASDWLEIFIEGVSVGKSTEILRATRFLRVIRSVRLIRLLKLPGLVEEFSARFYSEKVLLLLGIVKISLMFMGLDHIIACLWLGVGTFASGRTWVKSNGLGAESFLYTYVTAVHWATTNFVGSMEVGPQNIYERVFAVIVLCNCFIVSAAFVSRVTASMTRLQILAGSNESHFAVLRQYLRYRNVSKGLARRVVRSATHAVKLQAVNTSERDVELLALISEPLRVEVHFEIYAPVLTLHPFFQHYSEVASGAMRKLCHSAVEVIHLHIGDQLFTAGEMSKNPKMFFLMNGKLNYKMQNVEEWMETGSWACEANLWVNWLHVGETTASTDSTILALDSETFQQIVSKSVAQLNFVLEYAKKFHSYLNQLSTVLTDLRDDATFSSEATVAEALFMADQDRKVKPRARASLLERVSPKGIRSPRHSDIEFTPMETCGKS